jgi:DNA-binding LytR/AlgR family response regulator
MNCFICDDDQAQLHALLATFTRLTDSTKWECHTFLNRKDLMAYLPKQTPELLLMDIDLGPDNGIELVRDIHVNYPNIQVIFITGYMSYCTTVYEAEHLYFILKPVDDMVLLKALVKAERKIEETRTKHILVKNRDVTSPVKFDEVVYIENIGRKVHIRTQTRKLEMYKSIDKVYEKLDKRFVHCHKSFIVNMDYIKAMNKNKFILNDDTEIPISQNKQTNAKASYLNHLSEGM